jgi:hypothetical protein
MLPMKRWFLVFILATFVTFVPAYGARIDMGDLPQCDYPTLYANPGHSVSGIAWLGNCITADAAPHTLDADSCDDGVTFMNPHWTPCTMVEVEVIVTGGPLYPLHVAQGGRLFLNAWKDGNHDGDFCDILCDGRASEWIIQDVVVTPGTWPFSFRDPGVSNLGIYDGIFRFRLTRDPLGPFGFGLRDTTQCPDMCGGTFAYDSCGEVEDYIMPDLQLAVNLNEFAAVAGDEEVALSWQTLSENDNDGFELERDGAVIGQVESQGNSPSGHSYTFTDRGLDNGRTYEYSLYSVDIHGLRHALRTVSAAPIASVESPLVYDLLQNYPNPFNPSTQIVFDLKEDSWVRLQVYDLLGRQVADLVNAQMTHGRHTVSFDGTALPSGLYVCRMNAGSFTSEIKMLLMK